MQTLTTNNQTDLRTREQLLDGSERYFNAPTNPNDDFHQREAAVDQSLNNVQTIIKNLSRRLAAEHRGRANRTPRRAAIW